MSNQENIIRILHSFQKFKIVKCGMHHEQVASDQNKNPIYKENNSNIVFNRVKLCAAEDRIIRLGCAHSLSNYNFKNLLIELKELIPEKSHEILNLKNEFIRLIDEIYVLDHKKGQLEHDISLCIITSNYSKIDVLKRLSSKIKREHNLLMNNLITIKKDIESLIKAI